MATFARLSCAELDGTEFDVRYLIDGAMVAGEPLVVFGPSKSLKTSLVVDAAISLATANPFLGRMAVENAVRVSKLCHEVGVTLALVHHARKNATAQPGDPLTLADLAGAGFDAFARQWWAISRREDYSPGSGVHRLWLSLGGSAGHSALWGVDVTEGVRTPATPRRWGLTLSD